MNRAVIYIRVSTEEQVKHGFSIETQLNDCVKFAEREGYSFVRTFIDEGKSAKNLNRKQVQELLKYCENAKNKINAVIVWRVDRLSRFNVDYHGTIRPMLIKNNILLLSATELNVNTIEGDYMRNMMMCNAEYELNLISVMLDVKTSEVISYSLSDNLQMGFVLDTINSGIRKYPTNNLIIHSDRGVHYTNNVYQMLLKENHIQQSMSAPAAPRDNAPIESFFGHMKDELDYKKCKTFEELSAMIDDYMYNYNYTRKQWSKNKMTPIEYKNFLLVS